MRNKLQKGQTIIEAIVALVTILLIVTAIAIVIVNGLYNSSYIKNQNEANKLAQQGMEFVRNIQQNDLATFKAYGQNTSALCMDEAQNKLVTDRCFTDTVNTGTAFNRTILLSSGGDCLSTETKVVVNVKWTTSKCPPTNTFCHGTVLASCMPFTLPANDP